LSDSDNCDSDLSENTSKANDNENVSSDQSVSDILSQASIADEEGDNDFDDNAKKRKHIVKTNRQNDRLLELYIKKGNWSNRFIDKIATKLRLTPVQVYKWRWDRHESEKRLRDKYKKMKVMPEAIFYITKMKPKPIQTTRLKTIKK